MAVARAGGHGAAIIRGYIISPVANPVFLVREYATSYATQLALDLGTAVEICYWDKNEGTYSADWLAKSNFVVFLPTNNSFEAEINTGPMINEIEKAKTMGLPIYLGYRKASGIFAYETVLHKSRDIWNSSGRRFQLGERPGYQITGVSGTTDSLFSHCKSLRKNVAEKLEVTFSHHVNEPKKRTDFDWSYDERLLLLLL